MTSENKELFVKRFKSWLWRVGMLVLVSGLDFTSTNMGLFNLPTWALIPISLALSEVTKILNTK